MRRVPRLFLTTCLGVLPLGVAAQPPQPLPPDAQLRRGDELFAAGRYADARDAYRKVLSSPDREQVVRAGGGLVLSLLRTGDFAGASTTAGTLRREQPDSALIAAVYGDALWASGLFEEADGAYDAALQLDPVQPRGRHGRARALAASNHFERALSEALEAVRLDGRDPEFRYTVSAIHQRMRNFAEAAVALGDYVSLLPDRDRGDKAAWARAQIRFLASFKARRPLEFRGAPAAAGWTVPIRIDREKVLVRVTVNGGSTREFVLDTGAEQTVISRDLARRSGVSPVSYMQSAGVGDAGLRGLEVGRIDLLQIGDLTIRNVPCLIKNPPLAGLPVREPESLSPLALGLSMRIDYQRRQLLMAPTLPAATYTDTIPLRMYRLAVVRGTINGSQPATFVVDTGGEVISISTAAAGQIVPEKPFRRIPLKVYGMSGWDKDAFLMPNVDLEFSSIRFSRIPVVVLNLRAPSTLLGFQLGGIVGHKFLSKYRVTIDMEQSVLGLESN